MTDLVDRDGRAIDFEQARLAIERIAHIADAVAYQAGIGGMETAGGIISYLAEHPRDIEPFLRFGIFELPEDWLRRGCLTFHGQDGKIWQPNEARRAAVIRRLEKGLKP
jgi:hypothetical protein